MGLIPETHDAAAVWIAEYRSERRSDTRAFSSAARARRWVEEQTEQSFEWEHVQDDEWRVITEYLMCRVRRVTLHDPVTLRRRFEHAFDGEYPE